MAHECPDCGAICYCMGDIDDCLFNLEDDVNKCVHYKSPDCSGYDDEIIFIEEATDAKKD